MRAVRRCIPVVKARGIRVQRCEVICQARTAKRRQPLTRCRAPGPPRRQSLCAGCPCASSPTLRAQVRGERNAQRGIPLGLVGDFEGRQRTQIGVDQEQAHAGRAACNAVSPDLGGRVSSRGGCLERPAALVAHWRFGTLSGDGLSHGDPATAGWSDRLRLATSATVFLLRPTSRLIRR